jgi:hypothetical protein
LLGPATFFGFLLGPATFVGFLVGPAAFVGFLLGPATFEDGGAYFGSFASASALAFDIFG